MERTIERADEFVRCFGRDERTATPRLILS
jgi:hypothetical protein